MKEEKKSILRPFIIILVLLIILVFFYGRYIETNYMFVNEYEIKNNNIPNSFNNFKIAHFSDVLYKDDNDLERLKKVKTKINDKKIDVVIFSGDLIKKDSNLSQKEINKITKVLSSIKAKYGKYYVSGDNDNKNELYDSIMQNSGFISINNFFDNIYSEKNENILLIGLNTKIDTSVLTNIINDNKANYKILVFHQSDSFKEIKNYDVNLVLSSNSLNGQINIPGIKKLLLDKNSNEYYEPYYKVKNKDFYISNGIGNDKITFRLLNNPSFNIYVLKK
jgi:hypothetical protein